MEIAGLVISTAGLVSLFQTCLRAFDFIDAGRSLERDHSILLCHLVYHKVTFSAWGESIGLKGDGKAFDERVRLHPHLRPAIQKHLECIQSLFAEAIVLAKAYDREPNQDVDGDQAVLATPSNIVKARWKRFTSRLNPVSSGSRTKWVIRDKTKFQKLLDDLKELISQLREITDIIQDREMQMKCRRELIEEIESITEPLQLDVIQEAMADEDMELSEVATLQLDRVTEMASTAGGATSDYGTAFEIQPNDSSNLTADASVLSLERAFPDKKDYHNDAPMTLLANRFVGREKELFDIESALIGEQKVHGEKNETSTQELDETPLESGSPISMNSRKLRRVVLVGSPGIGKTQIALQCAKLAMASQDILWLSGSSVPNLHQSLDRMLEIMSGRSSSGERLSDRMWRFQPFSRHPAKAVRFAWLLIVDDVREAAVSELEEYLPRHVPYGGIIFTTRSRAVAESLSIGNDTVQIPVEGLPAESSVALLLDGAIAATSQQLDAARRVSDLLQNQPLAISHLNIVLRQNPHLNILYFDSVFHSLSFPQEDPGFGGQALRKYTAVLTVIRVILKDLKSRFPTTHHLICILAFLDPESIPLGLILPNTFQLDHEPVPAVSDVTAVNSEMEVVVADPAPLRRDRENTRFGQTDVGRLLSWSLIQRRSFDPNTTVHIHEYVKDAVLKELRKSEPHFESALMDAIDLIAHVLGPLSDKAEDPSFRRRYIALAPHFEALTGLASTIESAKAETKLLEMSSVMGRYFEASGRYDEAYKCFKNCCRDPKYFQDREVLMGFARACMERFEFEFSERLLLPLVQTDADNTLIRTEANFYAAETLAFCYLNQERLHEAQELYTQVLVAREDDLDAEPSCMMNTYDGLANTCLIMADYEKAEFYCERFIALSKDTERNIETLRIKRCQASLLHSSGRFDQAVSDFESVAKSYERWIGMDHPDTLLTYYRWACAYVSQKKYADAEELVWKGLGKEFRNAAENEASNPTTRRNLYAYRVLADLYTRVGKYSLAAAYFSLAVEGCKWTFGRLHSWTLDVTQGLSHLYQIQSRLDDAVTLLENVSPEVVGTPAGAKLARLYDLQANGSVPLAGEAWDEKMSAARSLAERTWNSQRNRKDSRHPDSTYTAWVLAGIYLNLELEQLASHYRNIALRGFTKFLQKPNLIYVFLKKSIKPSVSR